MASGIVGLAELGMQLLFNHDARVKAATEENAATQQGVVTFDADLATIFKAANAGEISATVAATACIDELAWWWGWILPLQQGSWKGSRGAQTNCYGAQTAGVAPCSGTDCTAACCIGNNVFNPTMRFCAAGFASGKAFSFLVCTVVGNKYGLKSRAGYTVSWVPPKTVKEAQVTISKTTGVISVGAPAGPDDVVISSGNVETTATADEGGIAQGLPSSTSGGDTATTVVTTGPSQVAPDVAGTLASLLSNPLYLAIGAGLLLLLLVGLFSGGGSQPQPAIIVAASPAA